MPYLVATDIGYTIIKMEFEYIKSNYPFSKDVERVFFDGLRENGLSFILPKRRTLTILKSLFGWRFALRIIRRCNL